MSEVNPSCPICGGLSANEGLWIQNVPSNESFVEGFLLGLIIERAARHNSKHVSALVCAEHLKTLRTLANKIPESIVGPSYRHLLNLGLRSVS